MPDDPINISLVPFDETRITEDALEAIKNRGGIYQRGRVLVEPCFDAAGKLAGILRTTEGWRMSEVRKDRIRAIASECCKFTMPGRDGSPVQQGVPDFLSGAILSDIDWPFPALESLSESPTLRPDGTIHDSPGYDPHTGNLYIPDGTVYPPVPSTPTLAGAQAAYKALVEPFTDFPFVERKLGESATVAAILSIVGRDCIAGPVPATAFSTPTPGTGKDLISDVITLIGTGRTAPSQTVPTDEAEMRKLLFTIGLEAPRVVSFGNIDRPVGNGVLSHTLTSGEIADRLLGGNKRPVLGFRTVIMLNGNGLSFRGDMGRRVVLVQIDARMERPEERSVFTYPDLRDHVRRERPRLFVAALTLLRAYFAAGKPAHGRSRKGSFEKWDDIVRGALIWVGAADPDGGKDAIRVHADADLEQLRALLCAWREAFGERAVTLAEAVESARPDSAFKSKDSEQRRALAEAFAGVDPRLGDRFTAASLAYRFRAVKGRIVEGLRLEHGELIGRAKIAAWKVVDSGPPPALPEARSFPALAGAAPWPPPGWTAHPDDPGWYYQGQEVLTEADLRARMRS